MDSIGGAANFNAAVDQRAMGEAIRAAGFTPELLAMFLQGNGVQLADVNDAPGVAGMYFTNLTPGGVAMRTEEEAAAAVAPGQTWGSEYDIDQYLTRNNIGGTQDDLLRSYVMGQSGQGADEDDNRSVTEAGVGAPRNLITEEFLAAQEDLELDFDTKLLVNVIDQNGQVSRRVVNLDWALEHAPDQIPTATIMGSADEDVINMTVSEALGLPPSAAAQYENPEIPTLTEDDRENDDDIQSMAEWTAEQEVKAEEAAAQGNGGGETRVVLELTPEARRLLQPRTESPAYASGNIETGGNVVDFVYDVP